MAPKKKSENGATKDEAEPATKESKVEADESTKKPAEAGAVEDAASAAPKFTEETDAPKDSRPKIAAEKVDFDMSDATLNVVPISSGKLLMALNEGGLQYFLASVRATVGLKAGRYMFEAKIVESLSPAESQGANAAQSRAPGPKQLVRIGLSLAGSSVILGGSDGGISFDSEGYLLHGKTRTKVSEKFTRGQTIALLLNLDAKSSNANTVSVFRDGVRASDPQPLPEGLRGKALFPTLTYKNVTLHVNFGPEPVVPLPFACRMVRSAAQADVDVHQPAAPKGGKYDVVFPIGLPDKGVFDWADQFLEKNSDFTELSDRKILEWATKSGFWRAKQERESQKGKGSNDRPSANFGVPLMDDMSARKTLALLAPMLKRNFLVMDLKENLVTQDRAKALARFSAPHFRKVAAVAMGESTPEYRQRVQELLLAEKQAKAEVDRKKKNAELERKRLLEEKKRRAEEAKKSRLEAQKKKEGGDGKDGEEVKEETKAEDKAEAKDEVKEEAKEEDVKMEEPEEAVQLTEEEKNAWYRKTELPDLAQATLALNYAKFSLPTKAEGFDDIKYHWQKEDKCKTIMQEYIGGLKKTQRVEDLEPGAWFQEKWAEWQKLFGEWKKKHNEFSATKRKALQKEREDKLKADGEGDVEPFDPDTVDVLEVEDIYDMGNGEPIFVDFAFEDWALLNARAEFHFLLHSFRKVLDDPDRPSFHESHLNFYYMKHFKKSFSVKQFAVEKWDDFVELVRDTVGLKPDGNFEAVLEESTSFDRILRLNEDARRERQRRIDAGDETARLKFPREAARPPPPPSGSGAGAGGGAAPSPYGGHGQKRPNPYGLVAASGAPPPPAPGYVPAKRPRDAYASPGYGGYR